MRYRATIPMTPTGDPLAGVIRFEANQHEWYPSQGSALRVDERPAIRANDHGRLPNE
jgi:hypothetical protein